MSLLPSPQELEPVAAAVRGVLDRLDRVLLGRPALHRLVMAGVLARGHILLEGLPGVGKTALVRALGDLLGLSFKRVQFTPDLMPGDILGSHILQQAADGARREMVFEPGPIFTNILLADEINRASPKMQSALLEAMQERQVSLLGVTRKLPDPFFVLASQNPIELEGTYPLPEAQLDRFLFKLNVTDVSAAVLEEIIATRRRGEAPATGEAPIDAGQLQQWFGMMERVVLPRPVARYIAKLVEATHPDRAACPKGVREYVQFGASPRAAIAMAEAARAVALIAGRPTVGFEDVRTVASPVLNHRLILNYKARLDGLDAPAAVARLLEMVDDTGLNLPADVSLTPAGAEAQP